MLLDSKSRMIDSVFTKTGKYYLIRGAAPTFFTPTVTESTGSTGFALGSVSSARISPFSMFTVKPGFTTSLTQLSSQKRFWARVVQVGDDKISDFGTGWSVITDYDDPEAGLVDLLRSVTTGSYNSRVAPWEAGSLVSVDEGGISLNGGDSEVRHTWQGFDVQSKEADEIVRPDLLAQPEFSQFVNGTRLVPTVRNGQGVQMPMKRAQTGTFQTDRLSPRSIRNRLVKNQNQSMEVQVETTSDYPNGALFKSRWYPVERRRFTYVLGGQNYIVETAAPLTVIQFDTNLYFVGKLVPVGMKSRPEITSNAFLRLFTLVFEDGT